MGDIFLRIVRGLIFVAEFVFNFNVLLLLVLIKGIKLKILESKNML